MKKTPVNLRKQLLLATACTLAASFGGISAARAQTAVVIPGDGASPDLNAFQIQQVTIRYKKLLLKEKDIPNAISHEDKQNIAVEGKLGSIQSLLRQTPSVNEYQSGPGQGVPVVTIRGVRLYELTETLDGTPMSDILDGGQGGFLDNNIGSPITLDEISGSTIYPGVAPPADQGFGSGGGTIAYQTLNPEAERSAEIFGSYGSFDTSDAGFALNTGPIFGGAGDVDAATAVLRYDQGYTAGFIDNTNERDGNMIFKIVKPYDDGQSHVSATVIYNRGFGYINTAPLPTGDITPDYGFACNNGIACNFPKSLSFTSQNNTYLTAILHDDTYINPSLILSADLFEIHVTNEFLSYQNPNTINYNTAFPYQVTFQIPYFAYGAVGPGAAANGANFVPNPTPPEFTYDPSQFAPAGSDPTNAATYAYGEAAELNFTHTNTIGFQPKANIFLPYNNITIGALLAKESSGGEDFMWGNSNVPQDTGYNSYDIGGGNQRSVYQAYIQDKIDVLNNKLHIQPGVTISSAYSSVISQTTFDYSPYKLQNFNVIAEPYIGISYDLPQHFIVYASTGKGGYFAPISTYAPNQTTVGGVTTTTLTAPRPEIIHLYEAGIRYDTSRILLNVDAYYQKITDADSFFTNYETGATFNGNEGSQQFRGYEASGEFVVNPSLNFFGNLSFNQSNYLSSYFADDTPFEDQFGYVFKGDPLASVPNWLANFGFDFNKDNFDARLTEEYTGQQFITYDFSPGLDYPGPNVTQNPGCAEGTSIPNECLALATVPDYPNTLKQLLAGPIPYVKQPGFLVSNLLLTYDLPLKNSPVQKLHFELNIQNLLDVHYKSHLYQSYAEIPDNGEYAVTSPYFSAFYGPPRSITASVSAKF